MAIAVRLVAECAAVVAVHPHRPGPVVAMHGTARRIHWDLVVVNAESVALRVTL